MLLIHIMLVHPHADGTWDRSSTSSASGSCTRRAMETAAAQRDVQVWQFLACQRAGAVHAGSCFISNQILQALCRASGSAQLPVARFHARQSHCQWKSALPGVFRPGQPGFRSALHPISSVARAGRWLRFPAACRLASTTATLLPVRKPGSIPSTICPASGG